MKRLAAILLTGSFILIPAYVNAQNSDEKWYEVEIIFFEHLVTDSINEERWPANPGILETKGLIELTTTSEPAIEPAGNVIQEPAETGAIEKPAANIGPILPTAYEILPPENYQLKAQFEKLVQSENYLPLIHVAWRQIIPERDTPDQIHIHSDLIKKSDINDLLSTTTVDETELDTPALPPPSISEITNDEIIMEEPKGPVLNGILKIGKGRYLHVEADLMLHKPELNESTELATTNFFSPDIPWPTYDFVEEPEPAPELFRIQNTLRLRSGEIHYMDHPLAGMIILFTPYTPPEPEIIEEESVTDSGTEQLQ